jgi:hypothetical protein
MPRGSRRLRRAAQAYIFGLPEDFTLASAFSARCGCRNPAAHCGTFVGHLGATDVAGEKMKKLLLGPAVLVAVSTAAHSTEDFCAVVLKTPDGRLPALHVVAPAKTPA